jgi:glucose/arabinose dehydrogenase
MAIWWALGAVLLGLVFVPLRPTATEAATLPQGFQESVAFSGLTNPTNFRFAPDGRVFVAEKSGLIKVFDGLGDTTPTVFADLRTNVHNFWDRGLLGLALHPGFTTGSPYVYVLYTYDHVLGDSASAPKWGTAGTTSDDCPTPPGATADGCVVSGRLSRLTASGNTMTGPEQVLIEDWCQQYPSHSIGDLNFGSDGALYVTGGDGASFNAVDYGQFGGSNPGGANPCGDPPSLAGTALSPPTAEGGALRSQDRRTSGNPQGDPQTMDGALLRVDPANGNAMAGNPVPGNRVVADGLRNPFRFTLRPGTNEAWIGDVGWSTWEEINRVTSPTAAATNFGWPCYEGSPRQAGYDSANLTICETLYGQAGAVTAPYYTYNHSTTVVSGETCPTGSSSVTGVAFSTSTTYPSRYNGALFFADYSRDCIWAMLPGTNGLPDPTLRETFAASAANPVSLQIGPGGDLFYADLNGGTIRRISFTTGNRAPTAVASATPTSGNAPLVVNFDGRGSSDPDTGDTLSYAWDLDGDGAFDDETTATASFTYTTAGTKTATLRVTDSQGASDTDAVTINVGSSGPTPPTAVIDTPVASTTWKVGDTITFSGHATDAQDGTLPASALSWSLVLQHCPSNCHEHLVQNFVGVASGSFQAPDHEYPSYLELRLTATDSSGLTNTVTRRLDPRTVVLTFQTKPGGLKLGGLVVGGTGATTPFSRTVIVGSRTSVSAPTPQTLNRSTYDFVSWSDGGAQSHEIVAPAVATTYTATYKKRR